MIKISRIRLSLIIISVFVFVAVITFAISGSIPTAKAGGSGWSCTYSEPTDDGFPVGTIATCTSLSTGCMNTQQWNGEGWTKTGAWCPEPVVETCGVWMPDVGDAVENGLVATDKHDGTLQIGVQNEDGSFTIVTTISTYYASDDWFQVPSTYRDSMYWFSMVGCGRWHNAQELGLAGE